MLLYGKEVKVHGAELQREVARRGYPHGKRNLITDVEGVSVGHCTIADGDIQTGVTAILPHQGDLFHDKVMAASHVINGFGKSIGLVQVDELGTLETPVLLTNTLGVGTASTALVRWMLRRNDDIGDTTGTVNPVVCECNDGYLNDIRGCMSTRRMSLPPSPIAVRISLRVRSERGGACVAMV